MSDQEKVQWWLLALLTAILFFCGMVLRARQGHGAPAPFDRPPRAAELAGRWLLWLEDSRWEVSLDGRGGYTASSPGCAPQWAGVCRYRRGVLAVAEWWHSAPPPPRPARYELRFAGRRWGRTDTGLSFRLERLPRAAD